MPLIPRQPAYPSRPNWHPWPADLGGGPLPIPPLPRGPGTFGHFQFNPFARLTPSQIQDFRHNPAFYAFLMRHRQVSPFSELLYRAGPGFFPPSQAPLPPFPPYRR